MAPGGGTLQHAKRSKTSQLREGSLKKRGFKTAPENLDSTHANHADLRRGTLPVGPGGHLGGVSARAAAAAAQKMGAFVVKHPKVGD